MDIPTNWTFQTDDVAQSFDRHVREQLPWYELVIGAVAHIARHYITDGATVYDLGCATGQIGRSLADAIAKRRVTFLPIDNSEAMARAYVGPGEVVVADVGAVQFVPFDVAISFLCLSFLPTADRRAVLLRLRHARKVGGVIIVVDKTESRGGYLGSALSRLALAGKVATHVPASEIIAKELSLVGVQRPLEQVEIGKATEVFRFGDFAGWVIDK